jgi:hypothetical protein
VWQRMDDPLPAREDLDAHGKNVSQTV